MKYRTKVIIQTDKHPSSFTMKYNHIQRGGGTPLTHFSPVLYFYRNQSFSLLCKITDWFLYETQHWAEMD